MNGNELPFTNRRTFLKISVSAALTLLPGSAMAVQSPEHQILSFCNIHTGESLSTCYRSHGRLIHRAVGRISAIMRDHRTGEIKPVDPNLLDLLHRIVIKIKTSEPINIISGYRSPETNAALRRATKGVAKNSLHMEGRAIDIRIPGFRTEEIRELAIGLHSGGVGYYPASDFVHLDTGPVKAW